MMTIILSYFDTEPLNCIIICCMTAATLKLSFRKKLFTSPAWTDWPGFCAWCHLTAGWTLILYVVTGCGCSCLSSCWFLWTAVLKDMNPRGELS